MRNLGNTNMKIKRVGFGGIPIQRITQDDTNLVINELEKQVRKQSELPLKEKEINFS